MEGAIDNERRGMDLRIKLRLHISKVREAGKGKGGREEFSMRRTEQAMLLPLWLLFIDKNRWRSVEVRQDYRIPVTGVGTESISCTTHNWRLQSSVALFSQVISTYYKTNHTHL
jgi:hypothetical protein